MRGGGSVIVILKLSHSFPHSIGFSTTRQLAAQRIPREADVPALRRCWAT
jgi:hypothetical protein